MEQFEPHCTHFHFHLFYIKKSHTKTSKLLILELVKALRGLLVGFLICKTTVMSNHVRSNNHNMHKLIFFFTYLSWVFLLRNFKPKLDFTRSFVKDPNNDNFHNIQIFYPGKQKLLIFNYAKNSTVIFM